MNTIGKGIGEILFRLREEQKITLEQLSKGICSNSQLTRIEQNQLVPDYFLLDFLFGRLGKSTERLEYVLPLEYYELYELRFLIQKHICHMELEQAEQNIQTYEQKKMADKPLHRQFIGKMKAQIAWIRQANIEEILPVLEKAIGETMSNENTVEKGRILNAEEIKLLLFRWEVCMNTEYARAPEELKQILEYVSRRNMCTTEKVKVLPYIAILLGKICDWKRENSLLEMVTKESLSLLRETGKLLYMPEILKQYADILEVQNGCKEFIKILRNERSSVIEVEAEYGITFEKFRLFEHTVRRFELDYELIRNTRIAAGITQEELSDGICAQESLARIEKGRSPRDKKMSEIMKKMNRKRERIGSVISAEEYEVLEIKRKIAGNMHHQEYDKADLLLEKLGKLLDMGSVENCQYYESEKIKILYRRGELDWNACIKQLNKLLKLTLDLKNIKDNPCGLMEEENSIINEIALISYENGDREMAIQLLNEQVRMFKKSRVHPAFHILEWELAMGNLALALEETYHYAESIEISREKLLVSMETGKGNHIGFTLASIAGIFEQQKKDSCVPHVIWCKDLLKLYKMDNRYQLVEQYVNSPDFRYKDEVRYYRHPCHHLY